jgi:uncharacterized phage protein (TIGR02218 family)
MLIVSPQFQAHLNGEATTHCYCWKLERKDGLVLGFTDHDAPLAFDGVTFEPQTGFNATQAESELGLSVSTMDVEGALSSEAIDAEDIRQGKYDGATVETFLVNWTDVSQRLLMRKSVIGRIELTDGAFKVELQSLAATADKRVGRLVTRRCDAELGDTRCGVNVQTASHKVTGAVLATIRQGMFRVSGLEEKPERWAEHGRLHWVTGALSGQVSTVVLQQQDATGITVTLETVPLAPVLIGDTFELIAGCDHTFETCKAKFANGLNFRGFPHLPGDEAVYAYPNGNAIFDGAALVP